MYTLCVCVCVCVCKRKREDFAILLMNSFITPCGFLVLQLTAEAVTVNPSLNRNAFSV